MGEKLKPNFTAVPNLIFDVKMRTLAAGATKVLFAICRYTYGWGKPNGDRISLTQLQEMTGMARGSVARSLKELGNLITVTHGDPSQQLANEYRINIEISDDELVSLSDQGLVSIKDQASLLASRIKRPSKENQRKKKEARNQRTPSSNSDPRVNTLLTAFIEKYQTATGTAYVVVHGKDPALLKGLLTAGHEVPTIEAVMDRYFVDDYHRKIGFDIGGFKTAFNRLNSAGAKKRHNFDEGGYPEL
jgi:phage replication O-like protein O